MFRVNVTFQVGGCGVGAGFGWGFFLFGVGCPFFRSTDLFGLSQRYMEYHTDPSLFQEYRLPEQIKDPDDDVDEYLDSVIQSVKERRKRLAQLRKQI